MIIGKYQAKSISQLYGLMPVFAVVASAAHTWCWFTSAVGKRTFCLWGQLDWISWRRLTQCRCS